MRSTLTNSFIFVLLLSGACRQNTVDRRLDTEMPGKIIWAWERPEDLRFLDPNEFGVAFLAQSIFLENGRVVPKPRRQPLDVPPGAYLIAVTRIETNKEGPKRPIFDEAMIARTAALIKGTLDLPNVGALQIDFDAVTSERAFYRSMVNQVKVDLPPDKPLTITSLASWCTGDAWFNDFPIVEAVPMVFQMGADEEKIKNYLRNGNDWREPLCRGSYGLSVDDRLDVPLKLNRRRYYFNSEGWKPEDLRLLQ